MLKKLLIATAMLCAITAAEAVPVTPAVIPRVTFVGAAGLPCAGCSLQTFAAGTTNPLATYTDSSGTTQNTNPIILDASGGANIWVGANSYKFILKSALGATVWSVDNVNAGNLFPCGSSGAVQVASGSTGLSCDSNITINTTSHTLNIGSLGANFVTIGALGTPTTWTFDTTTPQTALASLGAGGIAAGTINQLAFYPAAGSNIAGASVIPSGITATTQAASDNTTKLATTAYVASPGAISPTSLTLSGAAMTGSQGNGALVQHSTGTTTADNCAKFDASGNAIDSGISCALAGQSITGNGYTSLPGGLVIQWGVITITPCFASHCDSLSTPLPLTFPNNAFSCIATAQTDVPTGGWNMIATMVNAFDVGHVTVSVDTSQTSVHFSNSIPVGFTCYGN